MVMISCYFIVNDPYPSPLKLGLIRNSVEITLWNFDVNNFVFANADLIEPIDNKYGHCGQGITVYCKLSNKGTGCEMNE